MVMTCPNCNRYMEDKSYEYQAIGDWYQETYSWHEEFYCSRCDIKFDNDKWVIPEKFSITEKQMKTVLFISSVLGIDAPPPVKTRTWSYIKKHFEKAKRVKENRLEGWCEENQDWLLEIF